MKKYLFLFLLFFCPFLTAAEPIQLAENGTTKYSIVLPESPTSVQETAANELADYLKKITGVTFPIVSEDQVENQDALLIIGPSATSAKWLAKENLPEDTALAYDQVLIQQSGSSVILSGHPQRGMLYAVYTFLENDFGCRWWSTTEELVPENPSPLIEVTPVNYAPALKTRDSHFGVAIREGNEIFSARIKCNGHSHYVPQSHGGHTTYLYFIHSFYKLIPPEKYYLDHPDWFPEIDGHRVVGRAAWTKPDQKYHDLIAQLQPEQVYSEGTQLCLTNDEMKAELVKNALEAIKNNPDVNVISVSQNDWYGSCQCEKCRAINEEEGSEMGSHLRFINSVAEEIEKVYPNVMIETLAYQYTRTPPKHTRARHNVVIRLCSIECSYIQTKRTGEQNKDFARDLRGWKEKTDNLYIWDYSADFPNYYIPFPNFRIVADDYRFFIENHTIGVYEEGDYSKTKGNFIYARAWVTAKLLWDPTLCTEDLMKEFFAGYYAPEIAPIYMEYHNLLADTCEKSGVFLKIFETSTKKWLPLSVLNRITVLQNEAVAIADRLAKENPEKYGNLPKKVELEYLTIEMLWAMNGAAFLKEAQETGAEYLGPPNPKEAAEEFFQHFEKLVGYPYREWATPDTWEEFKEQIRESYQ